MGVRLEGEVFMEDIKFFLETNYPLAKDSYDYIYPQGAAVDNNRRPEFNQELKNFPGSVLDLGCAGGGFIKDCVDEGRIAIGLEGSDYCKKFNKYEWATIPDNLFTCDITKPFILHIGNIKPYKFNIVTMWEVFEHIEKKDIDQVFENIRNHLSDSGIFLCTITRGHSPHDFYREVDLHRTREKREWWLKQFIHNGFIEDEQVEEKFAGKWMRESRSNYKLAFRKDLKSG